MALRLLGAPIDLHAGGVALIVPHHENEIAQSEGATGTPFARLWMHVEHLMIEEDTGHTDKMSKSLGNVFNLADIVEHGYRPSALRYLYLGVHYRKQLKFSWTAMSQAEESLKRLTDFLARLSSLPPGAAHESVVTRLGEARDQFRAHIAADLNTAAGIGVIFDLVRSLNSSIDGGEVSDADATAIRDTFGEFDKILGVLSLRAQEDERPPVPVAEIEQLIEARRAARLSRNFAEADRIRKDLDARGITLEDSGAVTRWKRK
jgi:cysteinyl-tRNA synthetase